ncbi:MAG: hypothetical protein ACK55I_49565, partial [bacterium]
VDHRAGHRQARKRRRCIKRRTNGAGECDIPGTRRDGQRLATAHGRGERHVVAGILARRDRCPRRQAHRSREREARRRAVVR